MDNLNNEQGAFETAKFTNTVEPTPTPKKKKKMLIINLYMKKMFV